MVAEALVNSPQKNAGDEDEEHDHLDPSEEESDHHYCAQPWKLFWTSISIYEG